MTETEPSALRLSAAAGAVGRHRALRRDRPCCTEGPGGDSQGPSVEGGQEDRRVQDGSGQTDGRAAADHRSGGTTAAVHEPGLSRTSKGPGPPPPGTTTNPTTRNLRWPGSKGARALAFARAQLGKPYQWASAGPNSYDCSGLTYAAWKSVGVSLPRTSRSQYGAGSPVSRSNLQPGDLVFFYRPSVTSRSTQATVRSSMHPDRARSSGTPHSTTCRTRGPDAPARPWPQNEQTPSLCARWVFPHK